MDSTTQWLPTPKGLTLGDLFERFPTPDKAREYLEVLHWPNGPICPHCGNADAKRIYSIAANPAKKVRAGLKKCAECKKQFTVTVGTVFEDSHVPLNKWLIAVYLLCASKKGMSAHQLHRMLKVTYKTAWFMFHRLRYAMREPAFQGKLGGPGKVVESDETWIGGRARGVGKGKGWVNKVHVFAMVERGGEVRSMPMGSVTASNLKAAMDEHIDKSTRLMTDGNSSYTVPGREYASHERVDHSAEEYVRGDVYTNTIEGVFSLLKRGVHGTYHHWSKKYLSQYLAEFDFRYNLRKLNDGDRTLQALGRTRGKRLMLMQPLESKPVSR